MSRPVRSVQNRHDVINTPAPALAHAIYNATSVVPRTADHERVIAMGIAEKNASNDTLSAAGTADGS